VNLNEIDVFLVRAPSPLAPAFSKYRNLDKTVIYYLVGDYFEGAQNMRIVSMRKLAIWSYLRWNHKELINAIRGTPVLVNSIKLKEKIVGIAAQVKLVPTTTL
jgi:hypothetical protein